MPITKNGAYMSWSDVEYKATSRLPDVFLAQSWKNYRKGKSSKLPVIYWAKERMLAKECRKMMESGYAN